MKVCFVSHTAEKYGAENALIELIRGLKERGVLCYAILPGQGPLIKDLEALSVSYAVIPYHWWVDGWSPVWFRVARTALNIYEAVRIALRIRQWGCDVVYTNTVTVNAGALAVWWTRRPHIWHVHEVAEEWGWTFDLGQRFSMWMVSKLSDVVISCSKTVEMRYRPYIPEQKIKTVYQAVDIPSRPVTATGDQPSSPAGSFTCAIVGQLCENKGQEDAVRAVCLLRQKGIPCRLFIVGGGDPVYRDRLIGLVTEHGSNGHIHFTGYVDDPFSFMERADTVLVCSRWEPFGRVSVEAMRLGKPVIGARRAGTMELINQGVNGLFYTPGDYHELATRIHYLYEHPAIAQQMGENGRQWACAMFTRERYAQEVLNILQKVLT